MLFSEDFAWFVRATIHGIPFINCPEVLFQKRLNPLQTASKVGTKRILELVPAIHSELRWYQHLYQQHHPDYEVPSQ